MPRFSIFLPFSGRTYIVVILHPRTLLTLCPCHEQEIPRWDVVRLLEVTLSALHRSVRFSGYVTPSTLRHTHGTRKIIWGHQKRESSRWQIQCYVAPRYPHIILLFHIFNEQVWRGWISFPPLFAIFPVYLQVPVIPRSDSTSFFLSWKTSHAQFVGSPARTAVVGQTSPLWRSLTNEVQRLHLPQLPENDYNHYTRAGFCTPIQHHSHSCTDNCPWITIMQFLTRSLPEWLTALD